MSRRRAPQPSVPARPNGFEPGTTRAAERAPRARDAALHRASARQHALSRTRPAEYAKRRADGLDGDALSARRSWSSAEAAPPSPTSTATAISTSTLLHGRGGAGGGVSQRAAPAGLASGALLAVDETHTLVAGPGGLTARWARAGHARDGQVHLGRHSARGLRDDHRSGPACSSPDRRRPLPTWWRPAARSLPTPWRWPRLASRSPRFSPPARLRARCRARRAAGRRHRGRHRSARPPLARPPRAWAAAWTSSRRLANPQSVARRKVGGHTPPRAPPGRSRSVSPARRRAWLKRGPSSQLEIVRGAGLATDLARPHTNGLQPEGAGR